MCGAVRPEELQSTMKKMLDAVKDRQVRPLAADRVSIAAPVCSMFERIPMLVEVPASPG